jgi:hypothetical protein
MATIFDADQRTTRIFLTKYYVLYGEEQNCEFVTLDHKDLGSDWPYLSETTWGPLKLTKHKCKNGNVIQCVSVSYLSKFYLDLDIKGVPSKIERHRFSGDLEICACDCRDEPPTPGRQLPDGKSLNEEFLDGLFK